MRIWPPFAVAILLSAMLQAEVGSKAVGVSPWLYLSWNIVPSVNVIAHHLDLTQLFWASSGELDGPMWTLVHEFRISLIFPALVFVTFRRPTLSTVSSVALVFLGIALILGRHRELISSFASTAVYTWLFVAGAALASRLSAVRDAVNHMHIAGRLLMWIAAFAAITFVRCDTINSFLAGFALLAAGSGAIMIVVLCTTENIVTGVLETPIPSWLGKISYSLYLIHLPIILTVFHGFPRNPYWLNAGVALLTSLIVAEIMHRMVELPSMRAGRLLALRIEPPTPELS